MRRPSRDETVVVSNPSISGGSNARIRRLSAMTGEVELKVPPRGLPNLARVVNQTAVLYLGERSSLR